MVEAASWRDVLGLIGFLLGAVAPVAGAQGATGTLSGRVTSAGDVAAPVASAEVRVYAGGPLVASARTDSAGRFTLAGLPDQRVEVHVRRLGFNPRSVTLLPGVTVLDVRLEPMPTELDEVLVHARVQNSRGRLTQFYANRARAQFGRFFDPEEIEERKPRRMSDLMRFVPGVRLHPGRLGSVVRIRGCRPLLWVDGQRIVEAELDEFVNMNDVAAVEVYNSFAGIPPQYVDRKTNCGAVVVWTRS